jgi:hypothetical protein
MNLVVDEFDNSFKISFAYRGLNQQPPRSATDPDNFDDSNDVGIVTMHIYEPTTKQWRSATNPPLLPEFWGWLSWKQYHISESIVLY